MTASAAGRPDAPSPASSSAKRRGTEAALLAFAVLIAIAAQCIVDITLTGSVSPQIAAFGVWLVVLWAVAHLAVRRWVPYADPLLLPAVAFLVGLGLAEIHRLDLGGIQDGAAPVNDAKTQLIWATLGVGLFVAVLVGLRDHRTAARFSYTLGLVGIVLLALPAALPASISEVNGAKLWIRLGGFSIQPGEFAKICLIAFFAAYLEEKRDLLTIAGRRVLGLQLPRGRDLGPVLVAWGLSLVILVFEHELGNSLLIFGIFMAMLYVATERTSWLLIGLGLFAAGATVSYMMLGYVRARVEVWLDPFAHSSTTGYQSVQALYGLGNGGIFGSGLGGGRPQLIPIAKSDFITGALGEELGLFGLVAIVVVYLLLVERGLRTALTVRDAFGKLFAAGLSFAIAWQVFLILGGVTGLLPLTGLTTPFLSQGGSSLLANFGLIALLMGISDAARRPAALHPAQQPHLGDAITEMVPLDPASIHPREG
ncbi:MAG TPA: FtsW/RodA/SpoVE family cell cycle protein [Blastococcus sp.]|nr:FtsW/RodA/SpoVE family cell cycle protein [Blastococcus sp.]